jgi:hypothetical protein
MNEPQKRLIPKVFYPTQFLNPNKFGPPKNE